MKKLLSVLVAALMLLAIPVVLAEEGTDGVTCDTGIGIGVGITPQNSCPEIVDVSYSVNTRTEFEPNDCEVQCEGNEECRSRCVQIVENQRSYAFEGEQITFEVDVVDMDGIEQDCVKVFVTLDDGYDPIEAACVLDGTEDDGTLGEFICTYTVEPAASGTQGEYWVSVMADDNCGDGECPDSAPGVISLYLNPAVGLTIESQDVFGFMYDVGGDALTEGPYAGDTVYSPYFTVENTADPVSGLYILLQIYGTDMWDYDHSDALCPNSNVLDIGNVAYKASHLNVQTSPEWKTMPKGFANRQYIFNQGCYYY